MRRRKRQQSNLCPLCSTPADKRTKTPIAVIVGKRWHEKCLARLVTAQSLVEAKAMLQAATPRPADAELLPLFFNTQQFSLPRW